MPSNEKIREIKMYNNFGWDQKEIPVLWYCPFEDAVNDQKLCCVWQQNPLLQKSFSL